jgi:hypothetical protein
VWEVVFHNKVQRTSTRAPFCYAFRTDTENIRALLGAVDVLGKKLIDHEQKRDGYFTLNCS